MQKVRSRITAQGQISVPASVRKKLGIGPGSVIEWEEKGEDVIVKRSNLYSLDDLHKEVFGDEKPPKKTLKELKEGIAQYVRKKHESGRY